MKIIRFPRREQWDEITSSGRQEFDSIRRIVEPVLEGVRSGGDRAVWDFTLRFDGVEIENLRVRPSEISRAARYVRPELKQAIETASANIARFHSNQAEEISAVEVSEGITCWRRSVPIRRIGIYVPGGRYPLFSTVLMLGIPAGIAGCPEIVMCTPPRQDGSVDETILYSAASAGITRIYRAGGAQAIAAMAYGTESIPRVYKIFGPGNRYVTAAKRLVSMEGTGIDLPAGPSETAIIADSSANPEFAALDLLSQAEHGEDSRGVLVTPSGELIGRVRDRVKDKLNQLPQDNHTGPAGDNIMLIQVKSLKEALDLVNEYAPEHLTIMTKDPRPLASGVINAGSVFLGHYTPVPAGDYASGTNHVLPTGKHSRVTGGVSLDSFVKKITFQNITSEGISRVAEVVAEMAEAEGLYFHRQAVLARTGCPGRKEI